MIFITGVFALLAFAAADISRDFSHRWDHLMFVQQWPQSACSFARRHQCDIPSEINWWTVHGLWPSEGDTHGPGYCDRSWKFDESKIMDLEERLMLTWPNLYDDTPKTNFWKHEWEKHGTCAASLSALDDEHKYFAAGLAFHKQLDVFSALNRSGIVPSNEGYEVSGITDQLEQEFGVDVCVECRYLRGTGQLLYQIAVCLDKQFHKIQCPRCESSCRSDEEVLYPPIKHGRI